MCVGDGGEGGGAGFKASSDSVLVLLLCNKFPESDAFFLATRNSISTGTIDINIHCHTT